MNNSDFKNTNDFKKLVDKINKLEKKVSKLHPLIEIMGIFPKKTEKEEKISNTSLMFFDKLEIVNKKKLKPGLFLDLTKRK